MSGNTVFITYILTPTTGGTITTSNYSQAIHCNYIHKLDLGVTNPYIQEISLNFSGVTDFKFLADDINITNSLGTGFTAHKIYAVVQIVSNSGFTTFDEVKPDSTAWKLFDMTYQVSSYSATTDFFLTATDLTGVVFKVPLLGYTGTGFTEYTLEYLNYPSTSETTKLAFGEATYFFGNVATDIKADVYTTDISIDLPLSEFNSSTNKTWNYETVSISEIGIYDSNKNLVAIGKLNDPVAKDETIARTIVFALDF